MPDFDPGPPVTVDMSFRCGQTTCAWKKGKFCRWLGAKQFGQQSWCLLYDVRLYDNAHGWVARARECIWMVLGPRMDEGDGEPEEAEECAG